ncbi:HNH endonuclease [Nocardia sp. NPDC055165]
MILCLVCRIEIVGKNRRKYCSHACQVRAWKLNNRATYLEGKKRYRAKVASETAKYNRTYRNSVPKINPSVGARLRASHPCLRCGTRNRLEVHHIKSQSIGGGKDDPNNLVVLCHPCHALWHKFFNMDYWRFGGANSPTLN